MGEADFVQMPVCLLNLPIDPGRWPVLRRLCAQGDDTPEVPIGRHTKTFLPNRFAQRMRQMKTVKRHDRPALGLDPVNFFRVSIIGHGKHADGIGLQQDQGIDHHQLKA